MAAVTLRVKNAASRRKTYYESWRRPDAWGVFVYTHDSILRSVSGMFRRSYFSGVGFVVLLKCNFDVEFNLKYKKNALQPSGVRVGGHKGEKISKNEVQKTSRGKPFF